MKKCQSATIFEYMSIYHNYFLEVRIPTELKMKGGKYTNG